MSSTLKRRSTVSRIVFTVAGLFLALGATVTVSIGISGMPSARIQTKSDLLKAADDALYAAKRAGKNATSLGTLVSTEASRLDVSAGDSNRI